MKLLCRSSLKERVCFGLQFENIQPVIVRKIWPQECEVLMCLEARAMHTGGQFLFCFFRP